MSHVATIEIEIKDLDALKSACKRIGLVFRENQKRYKWYGHHVGDYPVPEGFKENELGKCEHAIGVPDNAEAYEIGVCKSRTGQGYTLLWDFWSGGYGLEAAVGENCGKLKQAYGLEVARKQAQRQGFAVSESMQANGTVKLTLTKMG